MGGPTCFQTSDQMEEIQGLTDGPVKERLPAGRIVLVCDPCVVGLDPLSVDYPILADGSVANTRRSPRAGGEAITR
jgi:hypothetical protein